MKPQFNNLHDFFAMDGYGPYVWSAWGLSFIVIIGLWLHANIEQAKAQRRLDAIENAVANDQA